MAASSMFALTSSQVKPFIHLTEFKLIKKMKVKCVASFSLKNRCWLTYHYSEVNTENQKPPKTFFEFSDSEEKLPDVLPEGLMGVGMGLGRDGLPLMRVTQNCSI
jgi:hypothetical protein